MDIDEHNAKRVSNEHDQYEAELNEAMHTGDYTLLEKMKDNKQEKRDGISGL